MATKPFAWAIAVALLIPAAGIANAGNLSTQTASMEGALALPAIPYRETISWLSTEATRPRQKVLGPNLDQLKFALQTPPLMIRDSSLRGQAGKAAHPKK